jgi:hypothetical protein
VARIWPAWEVAWHPYFARTVDFFWAPASMGLARRAGAQGFSSAGDRSYRTASYGPTHGQQEHPSALFRKPRSAAQWTVTPLERSASPEQVRQAVQAFGQNHAEREPDKHRGFGLYAALSFAAFFLLLILTVNLASLLLARVAERETEFAISRAPGASGHSVVRATLAEGRLLGFLGGVTGALAGIWGTRLLVALGPLDLPRRETIALDWKIALIVIVVGTLLGLSAAERGRRLCAVGNRRRWRRPRFAWWRERRR